MKKSAFLIAALVTFCVFLLAVLAFSTGSRIELDPLVAVIGSETPFRVEVANAHGVRSLTAWVEQNGGRHRIYEAAKPSRWNPFFRQDEPLQVFEFRAGQKQASSLRDGKARLIIETVSNDLRAKRDVFSEDVEINTQPPAVTADGAQHYINQGGSELVTFVPSGYWNDAGVRVGPHEFRSFPLPGNEGAPEKAERFSLFAFPWDTPADEVPAVFVRNASGAEVTGRFWFKVFPKNFRSRELVLDDAFLQKVVNDLDSGGSGDLLSRFLKINREMRKENNQALSDLRFKTEEKILWKGPFYRLGKVESFFADRRTYLYKGQKVDEQMHLGFDLSDVQRSPVKAANAGRVVHAGPLGIYGNCVVIDHGYTLQSIYGHMSEIGVKVGDMVEREQVIGRSGATGLAGGDHLHFSMQVDGVQVNPLEWWDEHWIQDRILSKLPKAATAAAAN